VYVNGGHVMAVVSILKSYLTINEALPDKRILEKLKGEGKGLAFYTAANKLKP
jgi:mannitol-1-phosphate/altronate dehydrogenase